MKIGDYINQNFDNDIGNYLGFAPMIGLDQNRGESNLEIKKVQQFICSRLNTRPELVERVQHAYAQDYKMIQQVFNQ